MNDTARRKSSTRCSKSGTWRVSPGHHMHYLEVYAHFRVMPENGVLLSVHTADPSEAATLAARVMPARVAADGGRVYGGRVALARLARESDANMHDTLRRVPGMCCLSIQCRRRRGQRRLHARPSAANRAAEERPQSAVWLLPPSSPISARLLPPSSPPPSHRSFQMCIYTCTYKEAHIGLSFEFAPTP